MQNSASGDQSGCRSRMTPSARRTWRATSQAGSMKASAEGERRLAALRLRCPSMMRGPGKVIHIVVGPTSSTWQSPFPSLASQDNGVALFIMLCIHSDLRMHQPALMQLDIA